MHLRTEKCISHSKVLCFFPMTDKVSLSRGKDENDEYFFVDFIVRC